MHGEILHAKLWSLIELPHPFVGTLLTLSPSDALHRLKDSTDLPETVLAEVNRSYSQLLFHLRELEVYAVLGSSWQHRGTE